jgi:hypothetical protein
VLSEVFNFALENRVVSNCAAIKSEVANFA